MEPRHRSDPGQGSDPHYPGTFLLAFREAAAGLQWQVRRWKGHMAECVDAVGQERVVGLENLFRRARQVDRSGWPKLITEFLNTVSDISAETALPERLEEVVGQLLVRLGPVMAPAGKAARVWAQRLEGTDLWTNLVIDFPNRMCYVTEDLVEKSGKPGPDWLEIALANLQARTPADSFKRLDEDMVLQVCSVADAYDSSRALLLDRLLPEHSPDGFFVALPGRDALFVLAVAPEGLGQIHLLKLLADKEFQSAPYPISKEVYWVRQGIWRPFPIRIGGEAINVEPPPEFNDILERLVPPESRRAEEDRPAE